jgi:hypothetical protein
MLEMLSTALPVFESNVLRKALVEPSGSWPKARLGGPKLTMGAGAGAELPPPPPQAAQTPTTSKELAKSQPTGRRRAIAKLTSVARASNAAKSQSHSTRMRKLGGALRCGTGGAALVPPVVVMVSVAVTGEVPVTLSDDVEDVQEIPGAAE